MSHTGSTLCFREIIILLFAMLLFLPVRTHLLVVMGWAGNYWGELHTLALLDADPLLAPAPSHVDCD